MRFLGSSFDCITFCKDQFVDRLNFDVKGVYCNSREQYKTKILSKQPDPKQSSFTGNDIILALAIFGLLMKWMNKYVCTTT